MSELVVDKQLIFDEIWKLRRNQQLRDDSHDADLVMRGMYLVEKAIDKLPSTDLIRCKDCEWWDSESKEKYRVCHKHNTGWKEDDYCSFADMREGDAE